MRSSIAVAVAGILSVASAGGHHNHALFHKRQHNQTCSTVWSTWYGEPTMVPLPPPPPPPTTSSTSTTTSSTSIAPTSTSTSSSVAQASPPAAVQVAAAAPPAGSGGGGVDFFGHAVGTSGMNGITYTPYTGADRASSSCKGADEITSDIQQIHAAGFNRIRLYATDCDQLTVAGPAAAALGMRLIIGTFPNSPETADSDFASQLAAIQGYASSNGLGNVDALLVANEPMSGGHATVDQVSSYLGQAKAAFPSLTISVALTHPELIEYGPQLCGSMDAVAAQIHAFFASNYVSPADAGDFVDSEMALMSAVCGGKGVFVSESGYPSGGGTFLSQIAGAVEQQVAISSIRGSSNANHITLFSSSTDDWKAAPGVQTYETMFNCLGLF